MSQRRFEIRGAAEMPQPVRLPRNHQGLRGAPQSGIVARRLFDAKQRNDELAGFVLNAGRRTLAGAGDVECGDAFGV